MKPFFYIGDIRIPAYGLMIVSGVLLANLIAFFIIRKKKHDLNDFIILQAYCILGAFVGAKLLFIIVSVNLIDWSRIFELKYLSMIMQGGFVFYGGLIGGLLMIFLAGKVHKIKVTAYITDFIFLIPFIHAFGRLGCFFAGCCYGRPYDGIGAVVFPEETYGLAGVKLFPVQLVEAFFLMIIALIILFLQIKLDWKYTAETYLILYAILRFILEYERYDAIRGIYGGISTSQWISILMVVVAVTSFIYRSRKRPDEGGTN